MISQPSLQNASAANLLSAFQKPSKDLAKDLERLHRSEVVEYAATLYLTLRLNERSLADCSIESLKSGLETLTKLAMLTEASGKSFSQEMVLIAYGVTEQIRFEATAKTVEPEKAKRQQLRHQLGITASFLLSHLSLQTASASPDYAAILSDVLQDLKKGYGAGEVITKIEEKLGLECSAMPPSKA